MRQHRVRAALGLAAAALVFPGCADATLPVQPTPSPIAATLGEFSLSGEVYDTAGRSLGGARVEIIDGPRSGALTMTDEGGRFSMPGTFTGVIRVTVSKPGYVSATRPFSEASRPVFSLEPFGPAANVPGVYTLTLTADSACAVLPGEARMRTYTATIVPAYPGSRTSFLATLSDARFFSIHNRALVTTAGDFASFNVSIPEANSYEWPGIVEQLRETTYVAIEGRGGANFESSGMTAAFAGYFQYCPGETTLAGDRYGGCPATAAVQCDSHKHQLTLVRR